MSQHLTNAVNSITEEIERLSRLRDQISSLIDESDAAPFRSASTKASAKKSAAKTTAPAKRKERPPVSQETRTKMANARRAAWASKKAAVEKTPSRKAATRKTAAKKTVARKTVAKKTAPEAGA